MLGLDKAQPVLWSSLTDDEEDEEDEVLARQTPPPATKSSIPAARPGVACDADSCGGCVGERSNFKKKFLRTRKIMVMHSNERGECCPRTLVDRKRKR